MKNCFKKSEPTVLVQPINSITGYPYPKKIKKKTSKKVRYLQITSLVIVSIALLLFVGIGGYFGISFLLS